MGGACGIGRNARAAESIAFESAHRARRETEHVVRFTDAVAAARAIVGASMRTEAARVRREAHCACAALRVGGALAEGECRVAERVTRAIASRSTSMPASSLKLHRDAYVAYVISSTMHAPGPVTVNDNAVG